MIIRAQVYLVCLLATFNTIAADQVFSPLAKPTVTSPVLAPKSPVIVEPRITSVTVSGCVKAGDSITILGTDFGGKSAVALGSGGAYIGMLPTYWSNNKIIATLPRDSRVNAGEQYFVSLKSTTSRSWLGNSNKYVRICEASAPDELAPVTTPPQQASEHPTGAAPEETADDPSSVSTASAGNGSLMNRGLPPVPKNLDTSAAALNEDQFEPNELVVISDDMDQARELGQQLATYGLRTKKRKILKGLGLVLSTFQTNTEIDLQQTAINIRDVYPTMWADVNHRYELLSDGRSTQAAKTLVKWNAGVKGCGKGLRIGLVDTEVDKTHPALRAQNITTHAIVTHGINKGSTDHGTAIATLLVGDDKSATFSGLLPAAQLFSAAVFRQRGENNIDTTAEWLVDAIDWLISQQVQVINMSVGGPSNLLVRAAIQRTIESGIPVIAAAGNGGPDGSEVFPAAQEGVIAVTAVDSELNNYKKASQGEYIDFAAPGVDIWAGTEDGSGKFYSGTSFAVPFVTASMVRTLVESAAPEAYSSLQKSVKDLGVKGRDTQFGWGLVQYEGACRQAQ